MSPRTYVVVLVAALLLTPVRADVDARAGASVKSRDTVGRASWYGPRFHGRRTTSGEIFDQHKLTAASPTLPMGTRVVVTNLHNGRRVHVRVNDRMPPTPGRVIDLSHAAARRLASVKPGVVPVRVEVVSHPDAGERADQDGVSASPRGERTSEDAISPRGTRAD